MCILGATASTYTVVAADAGKSIKVIVSFTDDAGNPESLPSNIAAVASTPQSTEGLQPPGAPGVRHDAITYHVENGRNWITFRWSRPSGVVDGYEILRQQNTRREAFKVIARIDDPNATSYEDHTVIESSDYYFQVRAFNSAGEGPTSENKCGFLDSVTAEGSQGLTYPGNVRGSLTENGTAILLTWTAPTRGYHGQDVSPATGYQILRWDVTRGYANWDILVENTGSTTTSYVDRDVAPHNTYDYKVRAWNDWGLGDRSFSAEVRTQDLDVIGAPRNFRVSSSSEGAALTWDAPEGVADTDLRYRIYRRENSGATVPLVLLASDHGATSYTDGTVVPGSEYHYQVRVDGDPLGSRHGTPTKLRYGRYLAPRDLSVAPVAPNADPAALSVADARVREGPDAVLSFAVTLDRPASGTVTVDYATANGTATAESDYTAVSGTLTFQSGETAKMVSVPVLDDAHDEGEETLTLRLSNASGARIADGAAIGTIENSDPIPKAWIARFGRTVTGHVLDAVEARLAAPRAAGVQARLAGQALPSWTGGTGATANDNGGAPDRALGADPGDRDAMAAVRDWMAHAGAKDNRRAWNGDPDGPDGLVQSSALTGRDLASGTSFALTGGSAASGGHAALWGRGAITRFDGREGALSVDGEVTTGLIGADWAAARWTAGLAVGHSRGSGGYRKGSCGNGNCAGNIEATLTGVYPYAGLKLTEKLSAWAAAGHGVGELRLTPEGGRAMTADLTMSMGAAGMRGEVLTPPAEGGLALAVKGDTRFTRTESKAAKDSGDGRLAAATADVWLVRTGIEGSRRFVLGGETAGMALTPSFELGARLDGGDAETGLGVDLGGGLAFAAPKQGLALDLKARGLIAHEASGFREWGASAGLTWDPRPETDRGLALSLRQSWGGSPTGGMDALLGRETLPGLAANDNGGASAGRLEAELGYGIAMFDGGFTGTPNLGVGFSETSRDYRLGWRLTSARRGDPGFRVDLDATRRDTANAEAEHGLMLRGTVRW